MLNRISWRHDGPEVRTWNVLDTSDQLRSVRERIELLMSEPSLDPESALTALQARILIRSAIDQLPVLSDPAAARLVGGSLATRDDLKNFLLTALPRAGGKLSEDDDCYFNLALSPVLKEASQNSSQSFRGVFKPDSPSDRILVYTVGDQPIAGVLAVLAASGDGKLAARRSQAARAKLALEILYTVRIQAPQPFSWLIRHLTSGDLDVSCSRVTAWTYTDTAIDSERPGWLWAAASQSMVFLEEQIEALTRDADVTLDLIHCGLLEGPP